MPNSYVGRDRLTALRILFLALVAVGIASFLAGGQSPLPSVVGGFVLGGLSFVAVVLLVLVYLGAKTALEPGS